MSDDLVFDVAPGVQLLDAGSIKTTALGNLRAAEEALSRLIEESLLVGGRFDRKVIVTNRALAKRLIDIVAWNIIEASSLLGSTDDCPDAVTRSLMEAARNVQSVLKHIVAGTGQKVLKDNMGYGRQHASSALMVSEKYTELGTWQVGLRDSFGRALGELEVNVATDGMTEQAALHLESTVELLALENGEVPVRNTSLFRLPSADLIHPGKEDV